MKITADTNVLVRALVQDDREQARAAARNLVQISRKSRTIQLMEAVSGGPNARLLPQQRIAR